MGKKENNLKNRLKNKGMSVRLQIESFKLNGDKGSGVPKLSLENLKITLCLRIRLLVSFDAMSKSWKCTSVNGIKLKLISFKGPYGLPRTVVATILTMLKPLIRKSLSQV